MKKISSVWQRNYDTDRLVREEVVPGAEWVLAGEGIATIKWDGTATLIEDGKLYKRYDAKEGRTPPAGWRKLEDAPDPHTGHWPGWLAVDPAKPEDRWLVAAFENTVNQKTLSGPRIDNPGVLPDGTYEACGPHFQGNPYHFELDQLIPHGNATFDDFPRTFAEMKEYLSHYRVEGVVFWHPDGRRAKVKANDFGLGWNPNSKK